MKTGEDWMKGVWAVCHVGVGRELTRVQAMTRKGAIRAAARKLGVLADGLDALCVMPPVRLVVKPKPGAGPSSS